MTLKQSGGEVRTEWLVRDTADGPMRMYLARPAARDQATRAVIVLQEAFGVNDYIKDVTLRLAAEGYLALAPDLFHRSETGTLDYSEHATAMELIGVLGPAQINVDAGGALTYLRDVEAVDVEHTSVVGFCFGGRAAFTAATSFPGLGGTVVFYGPGIAAGPHAVLDRVGAITGPVLLMVGSEDPTIPPEHLAAITGACDAAGVDLRMQIFPGAGHAFHCHARPSMYREQAAREAWKLTLEFLARAPSDRRGEPRNGP